MRILLCDDHRMMRDGLRAILEKEGLEVVGECANGRDAVAMAAELRPDVVVMDISMPELNGIDATRLLLAGAPDTKVIGLSMHSDRRYVVGMFSAGAVGYLLKSSASEELMVAVRTVASNLRYVSPSVVGGFVDDCLARATDTGGRGGSPVPGLAGTKPLSPREREVLQLLAEGNSTKEIAAHLDIAATTVETHRRQIMDKLNLRTIAELTKHAVREGLTPLE
jgi:two-component system, NarL family, response regulator NreC